MERIIIFGGSGFIGKHLIDQLATNYEVVVISRYPKSFNHNNNKNVKVERLRRRDTSKLTKLFDGSKAIINLAGESVSGKWTEKKMEKIRKSRLDIDSIIIRTIRYTENKPEVVIQGSAIGIYGYTRNTINITEETSFGQRGFLPKVAISHEESFKQLESTCRVVYARTGLVLDSKEGALPKIARQFKLFIGGKIASGKQWNSWIHIDDEVRAIEFLLENNNCVGAFNLTAPNPVQNKDFSSSLAKALNRPSFITAPSYMIQLFYGKMGKELIITGLKVLPTKLLKAGFSFNHVDIDEAFNDIYNN